MPTVGQGGTVTLRVVYQDGAGSLVDPVDPLLDIIDSDSVEVETDLVPTRDSTGHYHYDYTVDGAAPLGSWIAHWTGIINGVSINGDEGFEVVAAGSVGAAGGGLITLEEYKLLTGIPSTDTEDDEKIQQAIDWASAAVRRYTDRDFATSTISEERTYPYEGYTFVETDDFSSVTTVEVNGVAITSTAYTIGPPNAVARGEAFYWVELPGHARSQSPEMGFARNEDVFGSVTPSEITIDAVWGWPVVPDDVKQAVAWVVAGFLSDPEPYQSESIADYSYSKPQTPGAALTASGLPQRAQALLAPYRRVGL